MNDVLARTLTGLLMQKYGIHFSPENGQIRCLAHVVNLVVQKILASLIDADDPDDNDWYLLHKFLPFHYEVDDDEELNAMEDGETVAGDEKAASEASEEEKDEPVPDEPPQCCAKGMISFWPIHHTDLLFRSYVSLSGR